jgi:hypothetical protein
MIKYKKQFLILVVIFLGFLAVGSLFVFQNRIFSVSKELNQKLSIVKIDGVSINIEIADTPEKRTQGLSGRSWLAKNQGMFFVYDKPDFYSFWMKDMKFPIDIIWINENKKIIDISKNISPDSFPQTFKSQKQAQYVLEVNAGFSAQNNIRINKIIEIIK